MNFCVKNEEKCSHKAENKLHSLIYDRFRVMAMNGVLQWSVGHDDPIKSTP